MALLTNGKCKRMKTVRTAMPYCGTSGGQRMGQAVIVPVVVRAVCECKSGRPSFKHSGTRAARSTLAVRMASSRWSTLPWFASVGAGLL